MKSSLEALFRLALQVPQLYWGAFIVGDMVAPSLLPSKIVIISNTKVFSVSLRGEMVVPSACKGRVPNALRASGSA